MSIQSLCGALVLWINYLTICGELQSFEGYKVLSIEISESKELEIVHKYIQNATSEVDIWHWPEYFGDALHVFVAPLDELSWQRFCTEQNLGCSVMISDLNQLHKNELDTSLTNKKSAKIRNRRQTDSKHELLYRLNDTFPTLSQIEQWMKDLAERESLVTLEDIGKTYENRSIYVLRITGARDPHSVPAIWVDTGIHSREWIAHTSAIYAIRRLIEGYSQDNDIRLLVENMVWYIAPVMNPDGYAYTHEHNRYWRKNRAPPPDDIMDGYGNITCIGVDLNRNWNFHWGEAGVSSNSCSAIYPGPTAFSELETQAVSAFILAHAHHIHGFLTVHSYGQMLMTRWAYVNDTPADHEELYDLARRASEAITSVHNVTYQYGTSPRLLYPYSGGSPDWAKAVARIKYAYSVELRDRGDFGFVLPPKFIQPVGEELFKGIMVIARQAWEYGRGLPRNTTLVTPTNTSTEQDFANVTPINTSTEQDFANAIPTNTSTEQDFANVIPTNTYTEQDFANDGVSLDDIPSVFILFLQLIFFIYIRGQTIL